LATAGTLEEPPNVRRAKAALRPGHRTSVQTKQSCRRIVARWEGQVREWEARHGEYGAFPEGTGIHVALLTWRRPAYLERTLTSFFEHNDPARFGGFWYAADGGHDPAVVEIAETAGFIPAFEIHEQLGMGRMWAGLLEAVAGMAAPDDLVLNLEEDWESARPLPLGLAWTLLTERDCKAVRLFGNPRERDGGCPVRRRPTDEWQEAVFTERGTADGCPERVLIGRSWFAHPPYLAPARWAAQVHRDTRDENQVIGRTLRTPLGWPLDPVFWHIGREHSVSLGGKT
jgi:hypothetical protein